MKYNLHNLTIEELILLMEEAEDKLKINPLDSRALEDYNIYYNMIEKLKNA